jgi:hypothetical protein
MQRAQPESMQEPRKIVSLSKHTNVDRIDTRRRLQTKIEFKDDVCCMHTQSGIPDKVPQQQDTQLTRKAGEPNGIILVKRNPTIMNNGYPGGCATPSEQLVKQSSPESPLATVGKAVFTYIISTMVPKMLAISCPLLHSSSKSELRCKFSTLSLSFLSEKPS